LDLYNKIQKIPELEFKGFIKGCNTKELLKVIESHKITEKCLFFVIEDKNLFLYNGNGLKKQKTEINSLCESFKGSAKAKYSIEYLEKILKNNPCDSIDISFSDCYPMVFYGVFASGSIKHILAPRETDQEEPMQASQPETEEACSQEVAAMEEPMQASQPETAPIKIKTEACFKDINTDYPRGF
jgi:hypothetical protein